MKKLFLILAVCGLMVGFLSVQNASAGLIINGGFETGSLSPWTATITPGVPAPGTVNATVTVLSLAAYPLFSPGTWFTVAPYQGTYMAELKGDNSDASMRQSFTVVSPGDYTVSFAYNLNSFDFQGSTPAEDPADFFLVGVDSSNGVGGINLLTYSINDPVGLPVTSTGWQYFTADVTLAAGSHTLEFFGDLDSPGGSRNPASYFYVDAVDVNPVPVPAAVWLLGSGLIGLVGLRRRFKK